MDLSEIGFYTLSDKRALNTDAAPPLYRCEMILTDRCNFSCPYCRGLRQEFKGDLDYDVAMNTLGFWTQHKLKNVRFSGGEPLVYPYLSELVQYCASQHVEHIAVSSNGSYPLSRYLQLVADGVNDFSISLDACCSSDANKMANADAKFTRIVQNIEALSKRVYVSVGVVVTDDNSSQMVEIIQFASSLGVADIRIISSAQSNKLLTSAKEIPQELLAKHPILRYRVNNILNGRNVRGLQETDCNRCRLVLDDSVVCAGKHFPCVIYMREQGDPIGDVGPHMQEERKQWCLQHDSFKDPICRKNCLDVCIDFNNLASKRDKT